LKRRSESVEPTSLPRQWRLAWLSAPYGSPNDKAS
jgi:hypothetical protein